MDYELPEWVQSRLGAEAGVPWERGALQCVGLESKLRGVRPGGLFWFPDHKVVLVDSWKFSICNDGRGGNADNDPCHQAQTALKDVRGRYLDANTQPYAVLPGRGTGRELSHMGLQKGDLCIAYRKDNWAAAVFGDIGPEKKFSEGSKYLARRLDIDDNARNGGLMVHMDDRSDGVVWLCFCGTAGAKVLTRSNEQIEEDALHYYDLFTNNNGRMEG